MTAFDYSRSVATALRLITRFGTDAKIIRAGTPSGPPNNPTPGTPVPYDCKAVFDKWRTDQIDGTLIQMGDLKVLVASSGLSIEPTPADNFQYSATDYAIVNVMPVKPGGTVVYYELQVRK